MTVSRNPATKVEDVIQPVGNRVKAARGYGLSGLLPLHRAVTRHEVAQGLDRSLRNGRAMIHRTLEWVTRQDLAHRSAPTASSRTRGR